MLLHGANGHSATLPAGISMPADFDIEDPDEPGCLRLDEVEAVHRDEAPPAVAAAATAPSASSVPVDADPEPSCDRQTANRLVKMVQDLNRAMDEAKGGGLIIEPSLSLVQSQYGGDGSAGHLLSIKVFRKLC